MGIGYRNRNTPKRDSPYGVIHCTFHRSSDSKISGICVPFSVRVYSGSKLLFQRSLQSADSLLFPIMDCYGKSLAARNHPEEPQPLTQAVSYSLRSKGASVDFRWPLRSGAKQVRDDHFTMGISVESIYRDHNQTFSFPRFLELIRSLVSRRRLPLLQSGAQSQRPALSPLPREGSGARGSSRSGHGICVPSVSWSRSCVKEKLLLVSVLQRDGLLRA